MPIEIQCPSCRKAYRLRDELYGKKVTCANPECRKSFIVNQQPSVEAPKAASTTTTRTTPAKSGTSKESPALPADRKTAPVAKAAPAPAKQASPAKPPSPPEVDAESLAATLFSEDAAAAPAGPVDTRVINMTCVACDHQWTEPYAKQGKQVLCPECRHRQKVPDQQKQKAVDWRDPNANRPSLARGEELPEDLKQQQTRIVRIESLEQAGAIEAPEVEPRPLKQTIAFGMLAVGLVLSVVLGGLFFFRSRTENREQQYIPIAFKEFADLPEGSFQAGQTSLSKAVVHLAAAEHASRISTKEKRKEAVENLIAARTELDVLDDSIERDVLLGRVALQVITLGGSPEEVLSEVKIRWLPDQASVNRPRINSDLTTVQTELRRIFTALRREKNTAEFEMRIGIARSVARELARANQYGLFEEIIGQAFVEAELPEATAQIAWELHRASLLSEKVQAMAASLKTSLATNAGSASPTPVTAVVLWQTLNPDGKAPSLVGKPASQGGVPFPTRLAYSLLHVAQDNPNDAAQLASRNGVLSERLRALAYAAEYAKDPAPLLASAAELVQKESKPEVRMPARYALYRLAVLAAKAKDWDRAEVFAKAAPTPSLQSFARGEILMTRLMHPDDKPWETSLLNLPESKEFTQVGHVLGALALARHNARLNADATVLKKYAAEWPAGLVPFGTAGFALGLQDRN
jgi:hypothetical protein